MKRTWIAVRACGAAMITLFLAGSIAQAQTSPPPPPSAQDTKDSSKDSSKAGSKDTAKDSASNANGTAKDSKGLKDSVKDTSKDSRDAARVQDRDRDSARDSDAGRSPSREYSDRNDANARNLNERDAQNRDSSRDRGYGRDSREGSGGRSTFRAGDLRSADVGLWFDRAARDGLTISDVSSKGAIAKFGFQEGDRVVSVNGHRVNREGDFIEYLLGDDVRDNRIKVIVMRDGAEKVIWVEPAVLMDEYSYVENDPLENFGIVLDDRYDDRIVVWKVIPQSPAFYAGIRAGDVIATFRGRPLSTRQDFVKIVTNLDQGTVPLQVRRGERMRDFAVDVPKYEARSERRMAMRPNYDSQQPTERRDTRVEQRQDNRADKRADDRPTILPRNR